MEGQKLIHLKLKVQQQSKLDIQLSLSDEHFNIFTFVSPMICNVKNHWAKSRKKYSSNDYLNIVSYASYSE